MTNTISQCCNEDIDIHEGDKDKGNYQFKVAHLVTEKVFMNEPDLLSF